MQMRRAAQEMESLLLATDAEGRRIYTDQVVRAFVPYLLLSFARAIDPSTLPGPVLSAIAELRAELGLNRETGLELAEAIAAHYTANPPPTGLVEGFERYFRQLLVEGAADSALGLLGLSKRTAPHIDEQRTAGKLPLALAAHLFHKKEQQS